MAIPAYQVSRDADRALEEFSTELYETLAVAEGDQWSTRFGLTAKGKFKKTFPIPVSAPGFHEFKGGPKFRSLYERSLTMKPKEWQDGVEEKISTIESPDFSGWMSEPARIAKEARRHPDVITAAMLEANPYLDLYRSEEDGLSSAVALFADAHPVNVFDTSAGTFDNQHTISTIDAGALSTIITRFMTRKGPNGRSMRLTPTDILCPPALSETFKNLLESDNVLTLLSQAGTASTEAGWTNNRMKGVVQLTTVFELTATDVFYVVDRNGPPPWVLQTDAPEETRFDRQSEHAKKTRKVALSYMLTEGVAACLPHAIEKITVS